MFRKRQEYIKIYFLHFNRILNDSIIFNQLYSTPEQQSILNELIRNETQ